MIFPKYEVLDLEVTIRNKGEDAVGSLQASPFYPDNEVVLEGWICDDEKEPVIVPGISALVLKANTEFLVGHNLKFDLLWMLRNNPDWTHYIKTVKLWDTMIVEYLLSGQEEKFISLDETSKEYGGTIKDEKIKEYWDAGIDTTDIPKEELVEYLKNDLKNTELIFKKQYIEVMNREIMPLVKTQMEALAATTIMEHNGMYFNTDTALQLSSEVMDELKDVKESVIDIMGQLGIKQPNPDSSQHISLALFGGEQSVKEDVELSDALGNPIYYKTGKRAGKIKTKKMLVDYEVEGLSLVPKPEWKGKKKGVYSTSMEVIKELEKSTEPGDIANTVLRGLLNYRRLAKDINTYWIGIVKEYWPNDKCIHGQLHHCSTNTGRLSSSKPNLQNLSGKD